MSKTTACPAGMSKGLTILFAVAGGFAIGNLYWTQPLLASIADTLGVTPAAAGFLVTLTSLATQWAYCSSYPWEIR